jgi:hypothetical protein
MAMIYTISIEIRFTTLYMADLGTRAEPLSEGGKGRASAEERGRDTVAKTCKYVLLHCLLTCKTKILHIIKTRVTLLYVCV